jgi:ubiquinone/menaquinone biosynthesis C-methylase UbiE
VADSFAVYYALFEKYKSDYQIETILDGNVSDEIKARAAQAEFDERLALLGLVLDNLSGVCARVIEQENLVLELRDVLREAKAELLAGANVSDTIGARVAEREGALARKVAAGVASQGSIKQEKIVCETLRSMIANCNFEGKSAGEEAFSCIQVQYKKLVAALDPAIDAASAKIDAAFQFVDECFSGREMLVFMAELATRKSTTQFIARYGNDSYYKYNESMKVDSARMGLDARVQQLSELDENLKSAKNQISKTVVMQEQRHGTKSAVELDEFYSNKKFEYGFAGVCKMTLPVSDMKGLTVLDICCRRGMGVYKISSMVGNDGRAIGIDWEPAYIEEAKQKQDRAWRDSGLSHNNMEFHVAYPEDLIAAGIGTQTIDMVYINNVISLLADPQQAICEFSRVLKPDGLFVLETVFASDSRDNEVVEKAKEIGNSIQAALTRAEYEQMLALAGFGEIEVVDEYEVPADRGFKADQKVDVVPTSENVQFKAVSVFVRKK